MALVPIRIDRTSKPPLGVPLRTDGHWSVQGLVGAWAFNEGAGKLATNSVNGSQTVATSNQITVGLRGLDTSAGSCAAYDPSIPAMVNNFSIITKTSSTLNKTYSSIVSSRSVIGSGWALRNTQSSLYLGFTVYGVQDYSTTIPRVVAGESACISVSVSGGNATIYKNQNYQSIAISSIAPPELSGLFLAATYKNGDLSDYFNGFIEFCLAYNQALSPAQIASLSDNPWQIYEPEIVWIEVPDGTCGTTYTDTLTALAESYAGVTDVATYVDAATTLITAGVEATSAITMTEAVLATAQATDTVSDAMQRVESLLSVVQAADTVQDAVAAVESLLTTATEAGGVIDSVSSAGGENVTTSAAAIISVADVQALGEQILASASVTVATADAVTAGESVTTVTSASATVQDVVVMLEQVSSQLEAQAIATDEVVHGVAESLLASVEAISSVNDLQLMTDNLCIMAQAGASIGEIGSYLEQLTAAATSGASVADALVGALTDYSDYICRLPSEQRICRLPSEQRIIAIPSERRICRLTRSSL